MNDIKVKMYFFVTTILLNQVSENLGREEFCITHKDILSLPDDYNSLLEPKKKVIVGNDIKLLNIIQVMNRYIICKKNRLN